MFTVPWARRAAGSPSGTPPRDAVGSDQPRASGCLAIAVADVATFADSHSRTTATGDTFEEAGTQLPICAAQRDATDQSLLRIVATPVASARRALLDGVESLSVNVSFGSRTVSPTTWITTDAVFAPFAIVRLPVLAV